MSSPVQSKPPFSALGLSHDLILVLCPFPQVTLQYDHLFHSPHCPWTGQVCAVQDSVSFLLKKGNKIKIKFGDLHEFYLGMRYPDTWISGYLDIQAILAIHYPNIKKVEISKYPSIQISMISKYPCIQVSGYIKNWDIQLSKYPNPSIQILGYLDYLYLIWNELWNILKKIRI